MSENREAADTERVIDTERMVDTERFIDEGYLRIAGAVPRSITERCCDLLWEDLDADRSDPGTWTEPVVRVGGRWDPPFVEAATMPVLLDAYDRLLGSGRWVRPRGLGTFPVRFPHPADPGDTGWHVDGSFAVEGQTWPYVDLRSRGRGLLVLFLLTDVGPDDAPTRIKVGSHLDVPGYLVDHRDGRSVLELCRAMDEDGMLDAASRPTVEATGAAGDVYVCHPFLVHAAQPMRSAQPPNSGQGCGIRPPRIIAQPPIETVAPFRLDATGTSPVEMAVRRALNR